MKKNLLSVICYLLPITCHLSPITCSAAIPTDYYKSIDGKTGDAIRTELFDRIKGHHSISYSGLEPYYAQTDLDDNKHIMDMYSLCVFDMGDAGSSQKNVCDCWNKEHSLPQSWFGEASPMKSDLFHVIPTDCRVNNFRSNYPYGETSNRSYIDNDKKALGHIGSSNFSGCSGTVYEPDDEYKGDFARIYFYMVTRYKDKNLAQSNGSSMFSYNSGLNFTSYSINLLLKWHRQDPVSQKEIDRNNAVYDIQYNRNPFVDYPCLAEYIWGEHKGEKLDLSAIMSSENEKFLDPEYNSGCNCKTDDPTILYPKQSTTVAVGSASVKESVSKDILIQGVNLTKSLSLAISGTNAEYFSLAKNTITAIEALNGYNLSITYRPEATTTTTPHTATLTISSSELKSARTITLTGESKAELVTPATGTEFRLIAEGVGDTIKEIIMVKGTNLTSGLYVGVSTSASASKNFTVTPTSLTAAQVNAGATVTVTYTPKAIGEESTNLILNSIGKEFTQPTLKVYGSCSFALKEPTDITSSSATLHWTKTEKNSYQVDVFFLKQIEEKEVVILCDTAGKHATTATCETKDGYMKVGSGKNPGSMTYSKLDLSQGGTMVITAKGFDEDEMYMKVSVNGTEQTINLTASDVDYSFDIPVGSSSTSTIKIAADKGRRFYIKYIRISRGGTKEEREHVQGYPREEIYLFHTVSGLLPDTEYSYTVTPDGLPESEIATFTTAEPTSLEPIINHQSPITKFLQGDRLFLQHNGQLYNVLGAPIIP